MKKKDLVFYCMFLLIGFIILSFYIYNVYSKYQLTKVYQKTDAYYIGTGKCSENACSHKYQYNSKYIYETAYQTGEKRKLNSTKELYYNPNKPEQSFLKSDIINPFFLIFSLLFFLVPLIFILNSIPRLSKIATYLGYMIFLAVGGFLCTLDIFITKLLGILFISVILLLIISVKSKNEKIKNALGSMFIVLFGFVWLALGLENEIYIIPIVIGLLLMSLGIIGTINSFKKGEQIDPVSYVEKNIDQTQIQKISKTGSILYLGFKIFIQVFLIIVLTYFTIFSLPMSLPFAIIIYFLLKSVIELIKELKK